MVSETRRQVRENVAYLIWRSRGQLTRYRYNEFCNSEHDENIGI